MMLWLGKSSRLLQRVTRLVFYIKFISIFPAAFELIPFNSFMKRSLSYRNQPIDLNNKSIDCFLYDRDLRHEKS